MEKFLTGFTFLGLWAVAVRSLLPVAFRRSLRVTVLLVPSPICIRVYRVSKPNGPRFTAT